MALLDFLKRQTDQRLFHRSQSVDPATVNRRMPGSVLETPRKFQHSGLYQLPFVFLPPSEEYTREIAFQEAAFHEGASRHLERRRCSHETDGDAFSLGDILAQFPPTPKEGIQPPSDGREYEKASDRRESSSLYQAAHFSEVSSLLSGPSCTTLPVSAIKESPPRNIDKDGFRHFQSQSASWSRSSLRLVCNTGENAHRVRKSFKAPSNLPTSQRGRTVSESAPIHPSVVELDPLNASSVRRRLNFDASCSDAIIIRGRGALPQCNLFRSLSTPLSSTSSKKGDLRHLALVNSSRLGIPWLISSIAPSFTLHSLYNVWVGFLLSTNLFTENSGQYVALSHLPLEFSLVFE